MSRKLDEILDECLAAVQAGTSIEGCLARYPEYADQLRPLLSIAHRVRAIPRPRAREEALRAGKQRMLAAVPDTSENKAVSTSLLFRYTQRLITRITGKEDPNMKYMLRFAVATLTVVFLLVGSGLTIASAHALPGDILYPWKTAVQDVRLLFAIDPAAQQELEQQIQATRREDVEQVAEMRRSVDVRFRGILLVMEENEWIISGIPVTLGPETEIIGEPTLYTLVHVWATIQEDGTILARRLVIRERPWPSPLPTPTPPFFPTIYPTNEPPPTRTPPPWPTGEPTCPPPPTREPSPTPLPWPTDEPTPTPPFFPTIYPTNEPPPTHEPTPPPWPTGEPTPTPPFFPTIYPTNEPPPTHEPTPPPWPTGEPTCPPPPTNEPPPTHEPTPPPRPTDEPTPTPPYDPTTIPTCPSSLAHVSKPSWMRWQR